MAYLRRADACAVTARITCTSLWAILIACALHPSRISAQTTGSGPPASDLAPAAGSVEQAPNGLADIVVTARKRSENSRSVPIAMTTLSGAQLTLSNVARLTDLVSVVPNFTVSLAANQPLTFVRGFGSGGSWSFEQAVGKFVDNVSYGRDFDARIPLYDIERFELLKGPQVLLYGNSATAGALNITTRKPGARFEADASTAYDFENREVLTQGGVTVPLGARAALRIGGMFQNLDKGWIHNDLTGRDEPRIRNWGIRPSLRVEPFDGLTVNLKVEIDRVKDLGAVPQPITQAASPARSFTEFQLDDHRSVDYDVAPFFLKEYARLDTETYQGDVNLDLGPGTLTSTTAYRHAQFGIAGTNASQRPSFAITANQRYRQFSEELRFSGSGAGFDYTVGGYYQHDVIGIFSLFLVNAKALGLPFAPFSRLITYDQRADSVSGFADLTYHVTGTLSVSAGARYSHIDKSTDQSSVGADFVPNVSFNTSRATATAAIDPAMNPLLVGVLGSIPHTYFGIGTVENHLQPQVILQYKPSNEMMAYLKYVKGDKAGGVDAVYGGSVAAGASPQAARFLPERAVSFEGGIKGITHDRRLEYSLTLFDTTFTDLQTSVFLGTTLFVANAGKARSRGIELETTWSPVPQLRIKGSAAFQDARYLSYPHTSCTVAQTLASTAPPCMQDLSGVSTPFSSKYSGSVAVDYDVAMRGYTVTPGASVVARSRYNTTTNNDPLGEQTGFATIDARLTLKPINSWWSVSLFGRNVTNRNYKEYSVASPLIPGGFNTYLSRGRQLGVRLGAQF